MPGCNQIHTFPGVRDGDEPIPVRCDRIHSPGDTLHHAPAPTQFHTNKVWDAPNSQPQPSLTSPIKPKPIAAMITRLIRW